MLLRSQTLVCGLKVLDSLPSAKIIFERKSTESGVTNTSKFSALETQHRRALLSLLLMITTNQ